MLINSWSIYASQLSEIVALSAIRLAIQPIVETTLAAEKFSGLGELQKRSYHLGEIGRAAAEVCDDEAPAERRLKAATYLIELWNPYPFDPKAKMALRVAGPDGRAELRRDLILNVIIAVVESARTQKPRRIGRRWIKDEAGRRAAITLLDLEIDYFLRALRTLTIKEYEQLALGVAPVLISREVRGDSDGDSSERASSDEIYGHWLERLGAKIQVLSPRERQLLELLAQGLSKASAARRMNIAPSTARVLFGRIKSKLSKPM